MASIIHQLYVWTLSMRRILFIVFDAEGRLLAVQLVQLLHEVWYAMLRGFVGGVASALLWPLAGRRHGGDLRQKTNHF